MVLVSCYYDKTHETTYLKRENKYLAQETGSVASFKGTPSATEGHVLGPTFQRF